MAITPLILGTGRAGHAMAKSLAILKVLQPDLQIEMPIWLERGASLTNERKKYGKAFLCIANPHGLHAETILEADRAGFDAIICEKPPCVNLEELRMLRKVKTKTAVLHVYRQTWGLRTLKQMLHENRFGELISVEGRYWQASTAERGLQRGQQPSKQSWKDDTRLAGEYDVYLDIATHWVDSATFLFGEAPAQVNGWRSFVNADSPHRDSHVQLSLRYPKGGRAFASISKAVHGSTNHFEINVLGSHLAATWIFERPDEILIGEGRDRRYLTRKDSELGSQNPPHHGTGWLEGYIEIASCLLRDTYQDRPSSYPRLGECLDFLEPMLQVEWQS